VRDLILQFGPFRSAVFKRMATVMVTFVADVRENFFAIWRGCGIILRLEFGGEES